jgi:hypothetical protein
MLQHKGPPVSEEHGQQDTGEVELSSYRSPSGDSLPDEITPDLYNELLDDSSDSADDDQSQSDGSGTGANATGVDASGNETVPSDRTETMLQMLAANSVQQGRMLQAIASGQPIGGGGAVADTESSRDEIIADIVKDMPISDAEGSTFTTEDGTTLVNTIMTTVEKAMKPELDKVNNRLASVDGALTAEASDKRVGTYKQHINGLLDNAKVTDPYDREAIENIVTTRGVRQFNDQFNEARASQIFKAVLDESRVSETSTRENIAEMKTQQQGEMPPVQHGATRGGSSTQSIRGRLSDHGDKAMDFAGGDFRKIVAGVLKSAANR